MNLNQLSQMAYSQLKELQEIVTLEMEKKVASLKVGDLVRIKIPTGIASQWGGREGKIIRIFPDYEVWRVDFGQEEKLNFYTNEIEPIL